MAPGREHKKGDPGVQVLLVLAGFWHPILKKMLVLWTQIGFCCFMFVSRSFFLMIFVSESGRLGFKKQAFGVRGVAKNSFPQKLEFC